MKIPIAKPFLGEEEAKAAGEVILSGWVTQGPRVAEFEKNFASYVNSKYAVAVSSCTTGLHLAMIVAGVNDGDEVICPSMSYIATANCIRYVNAIPVFAEVNEEYNMDIEDTRSKISSKTKAILLVHQIGMPADIDAFKALCDEHDLILIEDAACAIGSEYKGARIGSHSDLVCFSFHPRKIVTTGDGGMITTSRKDFDARLKLLRQHAMSVNDRIRHESTKVIFEDHLELGYNYRMTDIQAAIGVEQLKKLDHMLEVRRRIATKYIESLSEIGCINLPVERKGYTSNYQSFSILLKKDSPVSRNDLMQKLLDVGISTRRGVLLAHRETAYSARNVKLPYSEQLSEHSIIIPLFVGMTEEETDRVIDCLKSILS